MDHRPAAPASNPMVPTGASALRTSGRRAAERAQVGTRRHARTEQAACAGEKKRRNWRILFQFALFGLPLLGTLAYVLFFTSTMGFQWGPFGSVVGVVRIDGEIASSGLASAKRVVPLLKKAFENPSVETVVLSIDSPGGAPVEAERIYDAIEHFKAKNPKPVFAVINNLGASAAYMIALHTDKIYAGKYSLVVDYGSGEARRSKGTRLDRRNRHLGRSDRHDMGPESIRLWPGC